MKSLLFVILGIALGFMTLGQHTRSGFWRLIRPIRVWYRVLKLRKSGFRTRTQKLHGRVLIHVYSEVLLKDVQVL